MAQNLMAACSVDRSWRLVCLAAKEKMEMSIETSQAPAISLQGRPTFPRSRNKRRQFSVSRTTDSSRTTYWKK